MKENEIKRSEVVKRRKGEHDGKMENWKAKEIERQQERSSRWGRALWG